MKKAIADLLAGTFAVFTVVHSGEGYMRLELSDGDKEAMLMKPHCVQILAMAMLRLLSCDEDTDNLPSQLVQVRCVSLGIVR